ncbi:hypothetical protein DFAR_3690054 [Desulfarculales bacterium]
MLLRRHEWHWYSSDVLLQRPAAELKQEVIMDAGGLLGPLAWGCNRPSGWWDIVWTPR